MTLVNFSKLAYWDAYLAYATQTSTRTNANKLYTCMRCLQKQFVCTDAKNTATKPI